MQDDVKFLVDTKIVYESQGSTMTVNTVVHSFADTKEKAELDASRWARSQYGMFIILEIKTNARPV